MTADTRSSRALTRDGASGDRWLAGVVFVVAVGAFLALELTDHDTSGLLVLVGPVVAALLVNGRISQVTEQQNRSLDKIEAQTNGVLDSRIEDGTLRALAKAGVVAVPPGTTTPMEPITPPTS